MKFEDYKLIENKIIQVDHDLYKKEVEYSNRIMSGYKDIKVADYKAIKLSPVKDQGSVGSCTGFAAVAALECLVLEKFGVPDNLSELFCYSMNKLNDKFRGVMYSGSTVHAASKVLENIGVCHESLMPYKQIQYKHPNEHCLMDALTRTSECFAVPFNNLTFKYHLTLNRPIMIAFYMFSGFYKPDFEGYIDELGFSRTGGHAVLIYGFEVKNGKLYYLIKNSWGLNYGHAGCCKIASDILFKRIKSAYAVYNLNESYKLGPTDYDIPEPPPKKTRKPWYKRFWKWLKKKF